MSDYGVIVGRFQVDQLHRGHVSLLNKVKRDNKIIVIFLACPRTGPTARNPLDFETRRRMLLEYLPDAVILPIYDEKSDRIWSDTLDMKIVEVVGMGASVILYGGRGSFIDSYSGIFPRSEELFGFESESGQKTRKSAAASIPRGVEGRAGAIYAVTNQHKRAFFTVDGAVLFDDANGGLLVLLGRKPKENNFRFPGGFVEAGESLETAVKREIYEETDRDINSLEYIGSFPVDDWRYRQDSDAKITTAFFVGWTNSLIVNAKDDLAKCHWFQITNMPKLEPEHEELKTALLEYLHKKGLYAFTIPTEPTEIIG